MVSTLSPSDLQSLVLAYVAVATVLVPVIGGLIILVLQNVKKIQEVAARQLAHEDVINGTQQSIVKLASDMIKQHNEVEK